ncbi:uncharacterized protein LOC132612243 [Lycium barbarum]|uniref:uncharacterized protein LOC132612243 n=1 Tax=Lycium barbarum TaxID=112863 RepID=UPI00293E1109|nr:uncharacterized protein LOC132612243 [Lycium barbarum]
MTSTHNHLCNSTYLADSYKNRVTEQPNIRIVNFQEIIRKELDIYVGKTTVRRARDRMLQDIRGDHVAEYGRIFDYRDEILRSNPGSTCVVKVGEDIETGKKIFEGFYVCFDALKKAFFGGTRRCFGLDGCFLKCVCKGQLLVAVCKDGNNQMLPTAWAVVEFENQFTWRWFVSLLKNDHELGDGHELTLISDMQKGLQNTVDDLLPDAEHRWCARHILANWSKAHKGIKRRKLFWIMAKSTFEAELRGHIDEMKKMGRDCLDDLMYYKLDKWCKRYFKEHNKCDSVDNNMAESFNNWILVARYKTIITMLEEIRVKMMKRIGQLREFLNTWITNISPMSLKTLQENINKSMQCSLSWNGERGFEIKDPWGCTHCVNIVRQLVVADLGN